MRVLSLFMFFLLCAIGCITKENPYIDPPFVESVDNPPFFQFTKWDYRCFPFPDVTPDLWEASLNHYGEKGWELAGIVVKDGYTKSFCLKRKQ